MTSEVQLRQQVCLAAQQLWLGGLIAGSGGMISAQIHPRRFLVTPPGRRRGAMAPSDLVTVDVGGAELHGSGGLDPAEWRAHRVAYQCQRNQLPPVAAAVVCAPPHLLALLKLNPGLTELSLAPLAAFPVADIYDEDAVKRALQHHGAIAARNQGLLTVGRNVDEAAALAESIEQAAKVEILSRK